MGLRVRVVVNLYKRKLGVLYVQVAVTGSDAAAARAAVV